MLETALGLALLILVNQVFFRENPAFIHTMLHPYWIVVLLIASRYGTLAGLFAGTLSAIAYIYLAANSGTVRFNGVTFPYGAYQLPFFFMLVGGVLGEIRSIYKKRCLDLETKHGETVASLQDLGLQHAVLLESKEELDKRIAFQSTTLLNLFDRLNELEKLEPESLFARIPHLLAEQLNVQCASVYLLQGNELRLHVRNGKSKHAIPKIVDLTYGMMGEVIRTKKVVTINQVYTEAEMAKFTEVEAIMSAPILRKDDALVGVVNIETMPFFDFNGHSVRIFETLCHWLSIVVDKALQFQQLKDKNIADEITGAYSYRYFQKRLAYEIARARRFNSPLSLLLVEIDKFESMNEAERRKVLAALSEMFSKILREIDLISKFKTDSTFALILPGQNRATTEVIIARLKEKIGRNQLRPFTDRDEVLTLNFGLSTLQLSEGAYESLVASAEARLRHGGVRREAEVYADLRYLLNVTTDRSANLVATPTGC